MSTENIFTIHPALAEAIPMMTDDELEELTASIAAHGQRVPIMLDHEVCKRGRRAAEKIADNFVAQVQAIIAARKAGEHIAIEADLLGQLEDAYSELLAELNREA